MNFDVLEKKISSYLSSLPKFILFAFILWVVFRFGLVLFFTNHIFGSGLHSLNIDPNLELAIKYGIFIPLAILVAYEIKFWKIKHALITIFLFLALCHLLAYGISKANEPQFRHQMSELWQQAQPNPVVKQEIRPVLKPESPRYNSPPRFDDTEPCPISCGETVIMSDEGMRIINSTETIIMSSDGIRIIENSVRNHVPRKSRKR